MSELAKPPLLCQCSWLMDSFKCVLRLLNGSAENNHLQKLKMVKMSHQCCFERERGAVCHLEKLLGVRSARAYPTSSPRVQVSI